MSFGCWPRSRPRTRCSTKDSTRWATPSSRGGGRLSTVPLAGGTFSGHILPSRYVRLLREGPPSCVVASSSAPSAGPVVQLSRVSKTFGDVKAVNDVSFEIQRGEFFSMLGPSGCGKTTTLRLLAGFEEPDEDGGEVRLLGEVVNKKRPYERKIAMVFQNYALFPHLSVRAQRRLRPGAAEQPPRAEIADRVRTRDGDGAAQARPLRQADAGPALRRAAPAGGAGPRARARARHPAARRAARRHRSQAPQGDAARAQVAQQAARHHLRLRHPRPGRSAHHVRPDRGHGQRAGGPARHARRRSTRTRAPPSWPSSSASPTSSTAPAERRVGRPVAGRSGTAAATSVVPDHPAVQEGKPVRIAVRPEWMDVWRPDAVPARRERARRHHPRRHLPGRDDARARDRAGVRATSPWRCATRAS